MLPLLAGRARVPMHNPDDLLQILKQSGAVMPGASSQQLPGNAV